MARDCRPRVRECRRIGHRRPRADHRGIVAGHIGDRDRDKARRADPLGKTAALDAREMFAHAVDFGNRCAGCEQRPRQRLLLGERQADRRRDPVGRRAARHQHGDQIVRPGGIGERQRLEGRGQSRRIGHRMPGFDQPDLPGRARVAVAGDRETADPARGQAAVVEIVPLRGLGHRTGALAGGEDDEPSGRRRLRQVRRQAVAWDAQSPPRCRTSLPGRRGLARP